MEEDSLIDVHIIISPPVYLLLIPADFVLFCRCHEQQICSNQGLGSPSLSAQTSHLPLVRGSEALLSRVTRSLGLLLHKSALFANLCRWRTDLGSL